MKDRKSEKAFTRKCIRTGRFVSSLLVSKSKLKSEKQKPEFRIKYAVSFEYRNMKTK